MPILTSEKDESVFVSQSLIQRRYSIKKYIYFATVAVAFLASVLIPVTGGAQTFLDLLEGSNCPVIEVVDEFYFPGDLANTWVPTIHGLAFRKFDRSLWGAVFSDFIGTDDESWVGKIHKFRENNGDLEIVKTIELPDFDPTGITFQRFRLWFASLARNPDTNEIGTRICKVSTITGRIIRCFDAPGGDSTGLTYVRRERVLWNAGFDNPPILGYLYKINPRNGNLLDTRRSPGAFPEGLANDGRHLWHVDWDLNKLYKMRMDDASVICSWEGPGRNPIGLTFDRRTHHLWLSDQGTRMIYKLDVGCDGGDD